MSGTIEIAAHPNGGAIVRPTSFLGTDRFGYYLEVVRSIDSCVYESAHRRQRLKDLSHLSDLTHQLEEAGFEVIIAPQIASTAEQVAEELAAERKQALANMERAEARIAESGLAPYPFQRDGIMWLSCRRTGILGDEMGLGKTVQTLLSISEGESVVVVCPATLKGNWMKETLRWRPDLRPRILSGRGSFRWPAGPRELVITSDNLLPDPNEHETPPPRSLLVYDEAHRGKGGRKSQRGRNFLALRNTVLGAGGRILLVTGTPLINRPYELKAVLDLAGLFEEAYGDWPSFKRAFPDSGPPTDEAAEGLRRVCLARRLEDVLPDLPQKTWEEKYVDVDASVRRLLDEIVEELRKKGISLKKLDRSLLKQKVVFELISKIRATLASAKIPAMIDEVARHEEEGQPLVVFSAHREPIDVLARRDGWQVITGDTDNEERTRIIERFQEGQLLGIAGTIGAMGVGVTLTRAHHALFVDLDWTPAGNRQAEDRLRRIGQQADAVFITHLIANHELDARVMEILAEKKIIIDGSVTKAAQGPQQQAADLIADLERRERIAREQSRAQRERAEAYQQEKQRQEQELAAAHEVRAALEIVPEGGYALVGKGGRVTFWNLDKPAEGRWGGWIFLQAVRGPNRTPAGGIRPDGSFTAREGFNVQVVEAVLRAIARDPRAASARYGRELGICGICGAELTNEESRQAGIGPICRQKF